MIKVDRTSVVEPEHFARLSRQEFERLEEFVVHKLRSRKGLAMQSRLPFNEKVWASPDLHESLGILFRGKCAFCESHLRPAERKKVALFRPKERAAGLSGKVDALHYWWRAYDWTNLYSTCGNCHSAKGARFPVSGRRAEYVSPLLLYDHEQALLLDPCRDDPEAELDFLDDGTVRSNTERGKITIEVFGLNRMSLVASRRDHCERVDRIGDAYLTDNEPLKWKEENFIKAVFAEVPDDWGFAALTRQHARRHLAHAQKVSARAVPLAYIPPETKRPYQGAIWLRRIEIENFKALRRLELEFPEPTETLPVVDGNADVVQEASATPTNEPWLMLLGENGVGKSSILKAVALAMMPAAQRRRYAPDPRAWVTRGSRAQTGIIRLEFTVGAEPVELHFSRRTGQVVRKGEYPDMAVLGYGSTRLLPPSSGRRPRPERVRLQNLFDSRASLRDAERWLADPKSVKSADFNLLASSLKILLSLDEEDYIRRRKDVLLVSEHGSMGPIRELSDGYQSVLALATDMMLNLSKASFDMEGVEGVVLLDELEVHLHPRWKIAIVGALRTLFPRVRFIATTHDPLCVQGVRKGELHVITRQGQDQEVIIEQFDVPSGARADQILTGAWFGVPSTRDPETVALMREHSTLLQKRSKLPEEQTRFDELDRVLRHRLDEYIGTEDEQIALQAAADVRDENRVRTGRAGAASANELREKVLEALRSKPAGAPGA